VYWFVLVNDELSVPCVVVKLLNQMLRVSTVFVSVDKISSDEQR